MDTSEKLLFEGSKGSPAAFNDNGVNCAFLILRIYLYSEGSNGILPLNHIIDPEKKSSIDLY